MIVVNKRYYDYDYDNNTIIMFDAEDVGLTLDFDIKGYKDDKTGTGQPQNSQSNKTAPEKLQSQSTETVPDDIIDPKQPTSASNDLDDIKEKEATTTNPKEDIDDLDDKDQGNISWISSSSPKGLRRIPYALQVAHSYTINKLEVQLTTLVDTRVIKKQKEERAKKKALALAQQEAYLKQQQQQQHAEYMAARHHQHGGHRQYPYPYPHPHGAPPPHGPHPPHARHPAYPHPQQPGYPPHGRHPHYPQRHPYPVPHPPHGYHSNGQRKQVAPTSPSGRGYGHRQNPQYYTTNTNHAVQQQNKSK